MIWWVLGGVLVGIFVGGVAVLVWLAWYLKDMWG